MKSALSLATLAAFAQSAAAYYNGFNYGSTDSSGAAHTQSDFEKYFKQAQSVSGLSPEFNSARLYTMIQGGTTDTPISAIEAAISTETKLLLGLWCSAGSASFDNEISALKAAIEQYGSSFTDLVVGISVGSEDLYRDSEMGIQADAGIGIGADTLLSYIKTVKSTISGTGLSDVPLGHVDTWTAWVNSSNTEVIDALDWVGFDGYPYFQNTMANSIDVALDLFEESWEKTVSAASGKDVWLTETGWPVSGSTENEAVASVENAKTYWDEVACKMIGTVNVFWYTLYDGASSPSFSVVDSDGKPLYDLSCSNKTSSSSSSSAASSTKASSTVVSSSVAVSTTANSTVITTAAEASSTEASSVEASSVEASTTEAAASSTEAATSVETSSAVEVASTAANSSVAVETTAANTSIETGAANLAGFSLTAALIALMSFVL